MKILKNILLICLVFSFSTTWAVEVPENRDQCLAICDKYFPGTSGTTPVDPVTPTKAKVFPDPITFERTSDQGNGAAAILFRSTRDGWINYVSVNGEVARKGVSYKGASVFLLLKSGDTYARPLKFVIKTNDGGLYTAVSGSASPVDPTTGYTNKETFTSYGERNGGRKAWRIPKRGDSLGSGPVKFVFVSGKTFTVKSTARNCRDREDTCNRDSSTDMDGFVFKPGNGRPNGEGDSDIGTAHGGIYLHAPYGDKSNTVTMYW